MPFTEEYLTEKKPSLKMTQEKYFILDSTPSDLILMP